MNHEAEACGVDNINNCDWKGAYSTYEEGVEQGGSSLHEWLMYGSRLGDTAPIRARVRNYRRSTHF